MLKRLPCQHPHEVGGATHITNTIYTSMHNTALTLTKWRLYKMKKSIASANMDALCVVMPVGSVEL